MHKAVNHCNFMRPPARDESAVFFILTYGLPLSVTFVRPDQAAAHFTLPAGGCNYLRWVTTALCCTGCTYTLRASGFPTHSLLSLSRAQSLHIHGWATAQRVFGQTSKYSVLASSTCRVSARLFLLRSFPAYPLCGRCACSWRIGIDWHLC